jgi:peptide/nickel transport system permease protein
MTSNSAAVITTSSSEPAPPPDAIPALDLATPPQPVREDRGSRSFAKQALIDTLARPGARVGILWVSFLIMIAVFAPFIANSMPIAIKTNQGWSSPLLKTLRPIDVILVVAFFTGVSLLVWRKWSFGRSLAIVAVVLAIATPLCVLLVRPPLLMEYDSYRRMEAAGQLTSVVRTIIPFSPKDRNRDMMGVDHPLAPSARHWFGTERNGADMLSQMIHASRIALSIGFVATSIAVMIGCTIGGLMGYFAGTVDLLAMRLIEIIEAVPVLLILLAVAALFGPNLYLMMVVIGLLRWTGDARFIRAEFLKLRRQDFVQAAIASGLPLRSIVFRHMLPNGIAPVLVSSTFAVGVAILLESTLSFLGLGDPDRPSWGQLLNQARSGGAGFHWWIAVYPGLAIFLTVFSYNLIGQSIRDAIDPKLRKRD